MTEEKQPTPSTNIWHIIISVVGAAFGVQSSKTRERDFTQGKPMNFIIGGIIFTIVFISTVFFVVSSVLSKAGM